MSSVTVHVPFYIAFVLIEESVNSLSINIQEYEKNMKA